MRRTRPLWIVLLLLWTLMPMLWQLITSLSTAEALVDGSIPFLQRWTFAHYRELLQSDPPFWRYLVNSSVVGGLTTLFTLAFAIPAAYALARMPQAIRRSIRGLTAAECCFSYRNSLFKTLKGKYLIISAVDLRLSKRPVVNTSYPALREVVPIDCGTPADVLKAVVAVRQSKLPDPSVEANVGSFFKNPIVDRATAEHLQGKYPDMPQYPVDANTVKLGAAWMIDQLGWRGVEELGVSVSKKHALVIINKSARYASEVIEFANKISSSVFEEYGVPLDREPELLGSDQQV